jgi:PIN domain nuclease of toxin-antitoxin system
MPAAVVDTHAITWYLAKNPALSKNAEALLDRASAEGHPIYVHSICLVELIYQEGSTTGGCTASSDSSP